MDYFCIKSAPCSSLKFIRIQDERRSARRYYMLYRTQSSCFSGAVPIDTIVCKNTMNTVCPRHLTLTGLYLSLSVLFGRPHLSMSKSIARDPALHTAGSVYQIVLL